MTATRGTTETSGSGLLPASPLKSRTRDQLPLFNLGPQMWDRPHRAASLHEIGQALGQNVGIEVTRDGWRFIVITPETREALRALDAAEDPLPPLQRRDAALRRGEAEDLLAATRAVLRDVQAESEIAATRRSLALFGDEEAEVA